MSTIIKRRSGGRTEAIEVAILPEGVAVLDSKLEGGAALWFTHETWNKFLQEAKLGKYDPDSSGNTDA